MENLVELKFGKKKTERNSFFWVFLTFFMSREFKTMEINYSYANIIRIKF